MESNPYFDINKKAIIQKVLYLHRNKIGVTHSITSIGNQLAIKSLAPLDHFQYGLEIVLSAANPATLYEKWTLPLMCLLNNLHMREQQLISIITAKEVEINQYKEEGAELKRRGVITAPFKLESFEAGELSEEVVIQPASIFDESLSKQLSACAVALAAMEERTLVKASVASPLKMTTKVQPSAAALSPAKATAPSINCLDDGPVVTKRIKVTSKLRL